MDFMNSLNAKVKGTLGEGMTGAILYHLCIKGYSGYPLNNIYLPKGNGEYSEIDLAYVTTKGIFVFECKNYSGWIFGSESDKYWTSSFQNGQKNKFYNPVMQNASHIHQLRKYVGSEIPCFSIIVFSDRCELKKINVNEAYVKVVKMGTLFGLMERLWPITPDAVSKERVKEIADILKSFTHADSSVKKAHVESIKAKKEEQEKKAEKSKETKKNANVDIMDLVSGVFRKI